MAARKSVLPRHVLLPLAIAGAVAIPGTASPARAAAQSVVPACNRNCAELRVCSPLDGACIASNEIATSCLSRQASCQAKYMAYDAYLSQMGAGVTLHGLPPLYREVLAPFYPAANLAEVRFGYSNRQPPGNATCDCDRIYFNNSGYVAAVETGMLVDQDGGPIRFNWLLHELAHFEQCRQVGSRDAYARMWWDHLSEADLTTLIQTGSWGSVHEQMQMEQQANTRRDEALSALRKCCIHPISLGLIRPLVVQPLALTPASPMEGQTVSFSASAAGGADPLTFRWQVRRPGAFGAFTDVPGGGATAQFTVDEPGTWTVRLEVHQPGNVLTNDHAEERTFTVAALVPIVTSLTLNPGAITGGASAQGTVHVGSLKPGKSVAVQLQANDAAADVPAAVTVTGGANAAGSATFTIATQPVAAARNVNVTAGTTGGAASATLQVNGLVLGGIAVDRTEVHAGELIRVRLLLDRPSPRDIDIVLESSDPRTLPVPRTVMLRAGETEKWIEITAPAQLARDIAVTLRARAPHDLARVLEQTVQLRSRR